MDDHVTEEQIVRYSQDERRRQLERGWRELEDGDISIEEFRRKHLPAISPKLRTLLIWGFIVFLWAVALIEIAYRKHP